MQRRRRRIPPPPPPALETAETAAAAAPNVCQSIALTHGFSTHHRSPSTLLLAIFMSSPSLCLLLLWRLPWHLLLYLLQCMRLRSAVALVDVVAAAPTSSLSLVIFSLPSFTFISLTLLPAFGLG